MTNRLAAAVLGLALLITAGDAHAGKKAGGGGRPAKQAKAPKPPRPQKQAKPRGKPENRNNFQREHPRRTQVLKREDRQNNHVNKDLTGKKLTYQQGSKIKAEEQGIRRQEQAEAKANGGRITKAEQKQLNREETKVGREINRDERKDAAKIKPEDRKAFEENHPRRTEVLKREDKQVKQVDHALTDKKLTYQQGSKIRTEERGIRRQEQAEAKANGGYITKDQQKQLNKEENKVEGEIKRDERKDAGQ
ncbi:MAG: hypothetical protein HY077_17990 [Elusimicrobia bacterium]|nr:hypothetical protein [Elusimicrobiota bacterium]